jgi:hypothetical protein
MEREKHLQQPTDKAKKTYRTFAYVPTADVEEDIKKKHCQFQTLIPMHVFQLRCRKTRLVLAAVRESFKITKGNGASERPWMPQHCSSNRSGPLIRRC